MLSPEKEGGVNLRDHALNTTIVTNIQFDDNNIELPSRAGVFVQF